MVVGRTSNYAEGFKSFTADDELMLANLKQALNYSAESLAIPDSNLKMPSKNNNKTNNIMPTMPDMEAIPTIPAMPTMSSMPTMPSIPTMPKIPPMPTNKATMANIMPNATVPMTTRYTSSGDSFKNVKQVMNKSKLNSEDDTDDEDAVLDEEEYPSFQKKGKGGKGGKGNEDDEDRDDIEEYEDIKEEDDEDREYNELKRKSLTRRQHQSKESIEGFRGSAEIEGRTLKNILLALLLSFIGYLVVYASVNNYLPITEISPQLKKFKHLVYGGIFFILAYICLEVF